VGSGENEDDEESWGLSFGSGGKVGQEAKQSFVGKQEREESGKAQKDRMDLRSEALIKKGITGRGIAYIGKRKLWGV